MRRKSTVMAAATLALTVGGAAVADGQAASARGGAASGSHSAPPTGRLYFSTGGLAPSAGGDPNYVGTPQVYSVRPDGSRLRQLTHVPKHQAAGDPSISPDGRTIAYISNQRGQLDLWLMTHAGRHRHRILTTPGINYYLPGWSPNGKRLVVSACDTSLGFEAWCDLVSLRPDGTHQRTLLADHRHDIGAQYSPDGRWIEFQSDRHGYVGALWLMPATGGRPHLVTPPRLEAFVGFWSPDGHRIVFGDNCCQAHTNTWTVSPSGRRLTQLTHTTVRHNVGFPAYSPDGRFLAVNTDLFRNPASGRGDLAIMRADGTHLHRIVSRFRFPFLVSWGRVPTSHAVKGEPR